MFFIWKAQLWVAGLIMQNNQSNLFALFFHGELRHE